MIVDGVETAGTRCCGEGERGTAMAATRVEREREREGDEEGRVGRD
jgi:hypothetical protein